MVRKQNYKKLICAFLTLLLLVISVIGGQGYLSASAATTAYTGALEDLQKDESFKVSDYPDNSSDYSIQVIQIAESTDGELFLYTYQPCQKTKYLIATDINMSLTDKMGGEVGEETQLTDEDAPKLYGLTLLNVNGVFCKYLVNGVTVSEEPTRYYNITSIYREWDKDIDDGTGNDNTINGVSYEVGQLWTVNTVGGKAEYRYANVVTVTDKYVDFLRYSNGFKFFAQGSCDSHYVAFTCDYKIDELYSAQVYYCSQSFFHPSSGENQYGDLEAKCISLKYSDRSSNVADGIGAVKYTWNRIERASDFVENEIVSNDVKTQLNGKQWVLRFCETAYSKSILPGSYGTIYTESKTLITSVSILRLYFKSNGKVYNLGVVDNKQSGDDIPGNEDIGWDFWQWLADLIHAPRWAAQLIFWGVLALIVLAVLAPILSLIFPPVGQFLKLVVNCLWLWLKHLFIGIWIVIKYLFIGLWWFICLPFRGIAALVRKKGEQPEQEERDEEPTKQLSEPKRSSKPKPKKSEGRNGKKKRK